ncbi:M50 family metallopeptidase [Amycolatopsis sp. ATCC 39116]|uniref:M50 family metallopeptidase n=1 Tax=Amycolatopsis sp. (strain ATCC 39116 / 75iv2) TaxID=385957 RepID=UPI000262656D|nr:M50 family metallopeptidase [Amycolatopsis sp. ATCC 39116]
MSADKHEFRRLTTAHHEAGHAVAHLLAGGTVREVVLSRDGRTGYTEIAEDGPREGNLMGWLVMLLAGQEANARFLTEHGYSLSRARRVCRAASPGDLREFRAAARGTGISEHRARRATERLVDRKWSRIHRAALRLAARGRLPGSAL